MQRTRAALIAGLFFLAFAGVAAAIIGGTPDGIPPDSPESRVDPNTTSSAWAGVGSLTVMRPGSDEAAGHFTASALDAWHVVTAAHVVAGKNPHDLRFNLNYGTDLSHQFRAQSVFVHPDYAGFVPSASGVVHDDLAIVRLATPLPFGVPLYRIVTAPLPAATTLTLVGYGASGDGVKGVVIAGTPNIKRIGRNSLDRALPDNGGSGAFEIYLYDFDGPDARTNRIGGRTLGNNIEATVAPGDSGSPAFIRGRGGAWLIVGINTFVFPPGASERFGGVGGGVLLYSYVEWIESILAAGPGNRVPQ